ncbi:MAG: prenyltransferase/squalene oxidase repeat-containing protein [Prolixibacteraceae bacterium]|jgi:squalene-hopene/tetraprenyl-beta-curcumene cyclase|nr:prenyltransferase/squalene oxidase repeat-containing protein [Prolixibacteraceae bacterium]
MYGLTDEEIRTIEEAIKMTGDNYLQQRFDELCSVLLGWQNEKGYWEGELSSSALGVSVACAALYFYDREANRQQIVTGMQWLTLNVNVDGGFGDTPDSPSNISTSLLCFAAVTLCRDLFPESGVLLKNLSVYLENSGIDIHSEAVAQAVLSHYGKDYTFSVPILTMCAFCGVWLGNDIENVPQLPFELSLFPRSFYRLLNLNVVSYAIPALVAVGIAIFKHKKKKNFLMKGIRQAAIRKAMGTLERMMPESGGFLEAIPLTAFVSLCLVESGFRESKVVKSGIGFLQRTQRPDGGWPIDVDLSLWVSSLAVKALRSSLPSVLGPHRQRKLADHFVHVQNKTVHPFNGTSPGGWGWTHFSGSVPDGDDTPGAILALIRFSETTGTRYDHEVEAGCNWLLKLQNSDGGFPTFTKGWGKLPFDRSCSDLTGHAVLAVSKAIDYLNGAVSEKKRSRYRKLVRKAVRYLQINQQEHGALLPLWFGNQWVQGHTNPVYGTARVTAYLNDTVTGEWMSEKLKKDISGIIERGTHYLLAVQNEDGSWGGDRNIPGSMEETALALAAIISASEKQRIAKGFDWLDRCYQSEGLKASPIGLYFASLWYHEKMYPLSAYLEAVSRALEFSRSSK